MSEDFNLSDKREIFLMSLINEFPESYEEIKRWFYMLIEQDKEFIRLLKETIDQGDLCYFEGGEIDWDNTQECIFNRIDKLAGDKLI